MLKSNELFEGGLFIFNLEKKFNGKIDFLTEEKHSNIIFLKVPISKSHCTKLTFQIFWKKKVELM